MASTTIIILVLFFTQGSLGHGGHSVNIEDAPFMAAVWYQHTDSVHKYFWCVGSIIHKRFLLTSWHCCLDNKHRPDHAFFRVGSTRHTNGGKLHQVEKYIKHKSFNSKTYENNVALLKLSKPVTFGSSVAATKLASYTVNIYNGLYANYFDWHLGEKYGSSRDLQQVPMSVSPPDLCNKIYSMKLTDKQICINNSTRGACLANFGAPLTAGNTQIGIFSYGRACSDRPLVYEKVAPHLQWIYNKIFENL